MSGSRRGGFDRLPESYGRVRWIAHIVARNLHWARTQGIRRLLEEHELHPARRTVAAIRKAWWRHTRPVEPGRAIPVFVFGMPRSGTNMLVRALKASPEVEAYNDGDRAAFARYRLREVGELRDLIRKSLHLFVVFKPILDSHRASALLDELGVAEKPRAVWLYRNVDDRTRSALKKFGSSALIALHEIARGTDLHRWEAQGLSSDSLELIRSIDWERASPADGASLLWYVHNRQYFELGLDSRHDVHLLSYDILVRSPEPTMRMLCAFLGVSWHPRIAGDIDARAVVLREPFALDPRIRACCDRLGRELDDATVNSQTTGLFDDWP